MKFECPHCQQHIQADEGYAGIQINCPSCNGVIVVPGTAPAPAPASQPPAPAPMATRLSVRVTAPAPAPPAEPPPALAPSSGATGCPSCGAPLGRGAVLCTNCGYNLVTKQRMAAGKPAARGKPRRASGQPAWYATPWPYLGVVAALVGLFYFLGRSNPSMNIGIAVVLVLYMVTTSIWVLVAAFQDSVATGFMTMCIPFYVLYFVFKVNENDTLKVLYGFNILIYLGAVLLGKILQAQ